MDYFKYCKNHNEVKRLYRELAMKLHPDHDGNVEEMIELNRQYERWQPPETNKFNQSWTIDEETFKREFKQAHEAFKKGFESKSQYGGYGGYRYNTVNDMKSEYFRQRNDPKLADYLRMKTDYDFLQKRLDDKTSLCYDLQKENIDLKKKLERLKKKFKKPPKAKKDGNTLQSICL